MAIPAPSVTDEDIQQQVANERVAWSTPGVTEVQNHITVRP